jgi:hypothetical protein
LYSKVEEDAGWNKEEVKQNNKSDENREYY